MTVDRLVYLTAVHLAGLKVVLLVYETDFQMAFSTADQTVGQKV